MHRIAPFVLVAAIAVAACGPAGSGDIATEERSIPSFDRVSVSEGLDLVLEFSPGPQRVMVTYDDNLLDHIATDVVDGELVIEIAESFRVTGGGRFVTVVTPGLSRLRADSGADVRATGSTDAVTLEASSGASLDFSLLEVDRIVVDASSGAYVAVAVVESLTGEASSGAEVFVIGDPAIVDVSLGSGADLTREDR